MIHTSFTHQRNLLVFILIVAFYLIQVSINIFIEGINSVFPPAFLFLIGGSLVLFLIIRKVNPTITMYSVVIGTYIYFFYLLTDSPYLINFLFMWLGLPLSAIYQNYRVLILAGFSSILLTVYSIHSFREEIFVNVGNEDQVYFLLFGLFLFGCLCLFIKISLQLRKKAEEANNKLTYVLKNTDIITWSYNPLTNLLNLSSEVLALPKASEVISLQDGEEFKKYIHPQDTHRVIQTLAAFKNGKSQTMEFRTFNDEKVTSWLQCRGVPILDQEGNIMRIEGILIDITKQKEMEHHIKELAYYDPLTGAANRYMLKKTFRKFQKKTRNLAILFIDMNAFKQVNDTYGHDIGDRLLKLVAERIKSGISESDLLCRLGGDEFVVLLPDIKEEQAKVVTKRIENQLLHPFVVEGISIQVSASIGFSVTNNSIQADLEKLIKKADADMYLVKVNR